MRAISALKLRYRQLFSKKNLKYWCIDYLLIKISLNFKKSLTKTKKLIKLPLWHTSSRIACRTSRLRQANNNASKSGRRRTYERTDGRNAKQQHGKKSVKNSLQKRIIREKVRRRISYITFCWKLDPKAFTSRWHCHYTTTALLSIRPISDFDRLLDYC